MLFKANILLREIEENVDCAGVGALAVSKSGCRHDTAGTNDSQPPEEMDAWRGNDDLWLAESPSLFGVDVRSRAEVRKYMIQDWPNARRDHPDHQFG